MSQAMLRRVVLLVPLALALVYGAHLVRVAAVVLPVAEVKPAPAPGVYDIAGAFHVHTTRSDGRGTPEEVAEAAREAGLSFVVLTDHNLAPLPAQRVDTVLLVPGVELSTPVGHVLAVGATNAPSAEARQDDPLGAARAAGGLVVLAHPVNLRHPWTGPWTGVDGMEVVSGDSLWREAQADPWGRLVPAVLALPASGLYAVLSLFHRPDDAFGAWTERLDAGADLVGLCAHDAHGLGGYGPAFAAMKLHLRLAAPLPEGDAAAAEALVGALGRGDSYCALDGLLDPRGFSFEASPRRIRAALDYARWPEGISPEIEIHRGPERLHSGTLEAELIAPVAGAYHAEVWLTVPWISGPRRFLWIWTPARRVVK